jgi:hypothetical protein
MLQPGDLFTTNYGWKHGDVHQAESVSWDPEEGWCIVARTVRAPGRAWPLGRLAWFSGYRRTAGGRLLGARYKPGPAGYKAQDHGFPWNGLGYDELLIVERHAQLPLFGGLR